MLLSASARTSLIREQQATASETADAIGLGAKEKLIVKDVVKDVDGTVHTRYERTYDGLPVLGGDLVVHEQAGGARTVTKAVKTSVAVATVTPKVAAGKAEAQALAAAAKAGSSAPTPTPRPAR